MFSFEEISVPCLMGIVNVTPDSFSDGGKFLDARAAAAHARELVRQGAGMLDLGAEASSFFRAGVGPIAAEEQLRRLVPVLEELRAGPAPGAVMSVDTRSAEVAREVLRRGAWIINDISAGTHEPEILEVVAEAGAGIVLMHMGAGFPATPRKDDAEIVETVRDYLGERVRAAVEAGISVGRIAVDPGVGFGKTMADNWRLATRASEVRPEGFGGPVVLGASRKRFLETAPPGDVVLPADWRVRVDRLQSGSKHVRDGASATVTAAA
ncbi:MAG TPA: dihydropteroate synthase, partial [Phycisphaerae bacterium]|nr:dihydropteroate synthase [Phycisphaerae bacterium]